MKVIAHRGFWDTPGEKNTSVAFQNAAVGNFGIETDVRDFKQQLVISHDPPLSPYLLNEASEFFPNTQPIAINIKADGLASNIQNFKDENPNLDLFVFDMSIPDIPSYISNGIPYFSRASEVEQSPVWLEYADGIWLDAFHSDDWYGQEQLNNWANLGKRICFVSPELHGRNHQKIWGRIKEMTTYIENTMICTDFPNQARDYFGGFSD